MVATFLTGAQPRREPLRASRFAELSVVALGRTISVDGRIMPQGARGTVVAAYADGDGYEVEFEQPFHAVLTLSTADLLA